MNRRDVVLAPLALCVFGVPQQALAQATDKVWRIGVLLHNLPLDGFRSGVGVALKELGYEEGRNLNLQGRSSQGRQERLNDLAAELVAARVDLIVAPQNYEIRAAMHATKTIPILMMFAATPVETGFIASLARPGGNVTGTTSSTPDLAAKWLEILRDCIPGIRRVISLGDSGNPVSDSYRQTMRRAAAALRLELEFRPVDSLAELEKVFREIERNRPDALVVPASAALLANIERIVEFAARQRFPAIYAAGKFHVRMGGLMSYSPNFSVMGKRNAAMIDRIFKGANPADIPVEEPAQFELTINLKTARAMGLTIPKSLLLRADEVIQ